MAVLPVIAVAIASALNAARHGPFRDRAGTGRDGGPLTRSLDPMPGTESRMTPRLKRLEDQVVVLTGATSGIGLATARLLARRGARLVLVARNARALDAVVSEIGAERAAAVPGDVAHAGDLARAAATAEARFGGLDGWVNNAAVAIYGTVEEVPIEDQRRLFDVNYWGVVHGSLVAARALKGRGGAIVNLGSVLSDRAVILQGPYSASKHAVKGFTDALRMELLSEGAPVSVTLVKPSAIDTTYMEHARTYRRAPGVRNPPPAYDPVLVARAIAFALETPRRDLVVGGGGWAQSVAGQLLPGLTDSLMARGGIAAQESDEPGEGARRDNLYAPREDLAERSSLPGPAARRTSLLLEAQMHPALAAAAVVGVGAVAALALTTLRAREPQRRLAREEESIGRWEAAARSATAADDYAG
jgi:NAD(P)-dependent dehydrogenase (short-subunit alcohol dehydrogenase family)